LMVNAIFITRRFSCFAEGGAVSRILGPQQGVSHAPAVRDMNNRCIPAAIDAINSFGESCIKEPVADRYLGLVPPAMWLLPHNSQAAQALMHQGLCDVRPEMLGAGFAAKCRALFGGRLPSMLKQMLEAGSTQRVRRITLLPGQEGGTKLLLQGLGDNGLMNIVEIEMRQGWQGPELLSMRLHKNLVVIPQGACPKIIAKSAEGCLIADRERLRPEFVQACQQIAQATARDSEAEIALWGRQGRKGRPLNLCIFPHQNQALSPIYLAVSASHFAPQHDEQGKLYNSALLVVLLPVPGCGYILDMIQPAIFAMHDQSEAVTGRLQGYQQQEHIYRGLSEHGIAPLAYWCGKLRSAAAAQTDEGCLVEVYSKAPADIMLAAQQLASYQQVCLVKQLVDKLTLLHAEAAHGYITAENVVVDIGEEVSGASYVKGVWLVEFSSLTTKEALDAVAVKLTIAAHAIESMLSIKRSPEQCPEIVVALINEIASAEMAETFVEQLQELFMHYRPSASGELVQSLAQLVEYFMNREVAERLKSDLSLLIGRELGVAELASAVIASISRSQLEEGLQEFQRSMAGWRYRLSPELIIINSLCDEMRFALSDDQSWPEIALGLQQLVELIVGDRSKADIWALGICIARMLGLSIPDEMVRSCYASMALSGTGEELEAHAIALSEHLNRQLADYSKHINDAHLVALAGLAQACLGSDPQMRPSAAEIADELQRYLNEVS